VTFAPVDSWNNPLQAAVTCRHLASGSHPQFAGRFYARCGLGTRAERMLWLDRVGTERLAAARALQEDFDRFSAPYRRRLLAAKAAAVEPHSNGARHDLERLVEEFLVATETFFAAEEARCQELGYEAGALVTLVADWCRSWAARLTVADHLYSEDPLHPFDSDASTFLTPAPRARPRPAAGDGVHVYADDLLTISGTVVPPALSLSGQVDASNAAAVGAALEAATAGEGDIHLDMHDLTFCDLAGLSEVVRASRRLTGGRRLVVRGLPAHLRDALRLTGWAELPALVIVPKVAADAAP
jgi:anti-anti-sigma regulatory factor